MNITIGRPTHGHQDTPEAKLKEELSGFAINEHDDLLYFVKPVNLLTREWNDAQHLETYLQEQLEYNQAHESNPFQYTADAVKYLHTWSDRARAWIIDEALEMALDFGLTLEWINKTGLETLANLHYNERNRLEVENLLPDIAQRLYLIVKQAQEPHQEEE